MARRGHSAPPDDAEMGTSTVQAPNGDNALPKTPLPRVQLDSIDRVRRELVRLYLEGKQGRRDVAEVSKLANVLALVARLVEGGELEGRLEELEKRLGAER